MVATVHPKNLARLILALAIVFAGGCTQRATPADSTSSYEATSTAEAARPDTPVRNIIILIGDGMGFEHVSAASIASGKTMAFEEFPVRVAMSTYSGDGTGYDVAQAWTDPAYVLLGATDSAAAATAMATGMKTYDAAIGVSGTAAEPHEVGSVMEVAERTGRSTGVVTSVPWSHATPAAFVAHVPLRSEYERIARQMVEDSAVDVIMGAGSPLYDRDGERLAAPGDAAYVGGEETWGALVAGTAGGDADGDGDADAWTLLQTRDDVLALASGATPDRVLVTAQVARTLQQERGGDATADAYEVPLIESVPTLAEMTRGALNVLDDDPEGFVLMVEGGAIDWASHDNQSGRMLEEMAGFSAAVDEVVAWVDANSDWDETLVIVTADHETGYLTGGELPQAGQGFVWRPVVQGSGRLPAMQWNSDGHTNSLVPLFARGGASGLLGSNADRRDPVRGAYLDNTDIAEVVMRVLRR